MPDQCLQSRVGTLVFYASIVLLVLLADQISKLWVLNHFMPGESLSVNAFCNLTLVFNPGAAFSFLADHAGWQRWFFVVIALLISVWILGQLKSMTEKTLYGLGLALIMGGALGNVIDRLWLGMVIDFIDLHAGNWHWPAFNVADSAVCVGAALFVLYQGRSANRR